MKALLAIPWIYDAAQTLTGFAGVRRKVIGEYLSLQGGETILDIGCGPGHILRYLPKTVAYLGFDTDPRYIEEAHRRYGHRARFQCREFDVQVAREVGPVDIVMFNGVLHHMPEAVAASALAAAAEALRPGGRLLTLDGCYTEGQRLISRMLLDHDRGRHVRTREGYEQLIRPSFPTLEVDLRGDLSLIPYDFLVMVARKAEP